MAYNQSDDEDETVVLGTPFAALEENEMASKKPELDLTVRDAQGRRRFHGAFTGGFSAGHYMTVGTEEGFTPRQYISNRIEKWDQSLVQRKPEDFMDSEDLGVFGIAPKRITTKEKFTELEFAGFRKTDSLIDVLKSVIKPTVESIGLKLYKRMKLKARNEDKYNEPKVYSCEKPSNTTENNNFSMSLYKPKSDLHGIGYKAIADANDSNQLKSSVGVSAVFKSGRKLKISGEAFGYGVLDEDNEDDAVVYQRDDLSQYDFEIGSQRPQLMDKNKDKRKAIDVLRSDVIEGFVKCSTKINLMQIISKKYPIPVVPHNWKPKSIESKPKKSRWDQTRDEQNRIKSVESEEKTPAKPPVLNANIRAILLGEEVVHRQGIKKTENENKSLDSITVSLIENRDKESLNQKKNDWNLNKPLTGFWANKFTRSSDGIEEPVSGGLTEFKTNPKVVNEKVEKENERKDWTERTTYEWHPHSLLCKRFNIPNPFPQYPDFVGVVTVGKSDVRNRTSQLSAKKVKQNIFEGLFDQNVLPKPNQVVTQTNDNVESDAKIDENSLKTNVINDNNEEESDETTRPTIDLFRAIFASDEDSDEDSEPIDQIDSNSNNFENKLTTNEDKSTNELKTSELSATKMSGIFANIDFDQLNRNFTPILKSSETDGHKESVVLPKESETNKSVEQSVEQSKPNDDFYGPALPPNPSLLFNSNSNLNISHINSKSLKRKKKDKKEKKHKKLKKEKTTHKKHKRHRKASTSSSSSSDVDSKILGLFRSARK